jgi:hypothetical protein
MSRLAAQEQEQVWKRLHDVLKAELERAKERLNRWERRDFRVVRVCDQANTFINMLYARMPADEQKEDGVGIPYEAITTELVRLRGISGTA